MPPFSPGRRVVVLGAGATRGSVLPDDRQCDPPLNLDFFTQLQRITRGKHQATIDAVINDVLDLFGADFSLSLEEYFTQLESLGKTARLASRTDPTLTVGEINDRRARLMKALAAVLEESTDVSKTDREACARHAKVVECLDAQDTIISFNYDCVMDHALRRHGDGKWSARYGYTFNKPNRIAGYDHWHAADPPRASRESLYLLKLHGSLNWQLPPKESARDGEIRLKQRLYQQAGTPKFTIIPPEFVKNIESDDNFATLWQNAERALRNAETIALVGFSFTPTDLHVESLFRYAMASGNLKTLVIANPSKDHRRRIRSVFARQLQSGAVVRQYDDFGQFAAALPAALT